MEALTEYAYRARLRDITDISVLVETSASKMGEPVHISSDTLAQVHQMDVSFLLSQSIYTNNNKPSCIYRFQMSGDM
jgi:hypothetical protein